MSVPEGISYKLRRADEQFEALNKAIQGFLEATPQPYRIVTRDDPNTRDRIYDMVTIRPPPAVEWAIVVGEILYQLRSGLDHLAYALCLAHAPSKTPPSGTEFPIFWDEDRFEDVERGGGLYKIRGMSDKMQDAIRGEQPYKRGHPPKAQSIWVLQDMSNIDKHRYLHVAMVGYPVISYFVDPDVEIIPVYSKDSPEIARARPLKPQAEVKDDPVFAPQVVLDESLPGDWRPLDIQLGVFIRIVSEIVGDLSQRFLAI